MVGGVKQGRHQIQHSDPGPSQPTDQGGGEREWGVGGEDRQSLPDARPPHSHTHLQSLDCAGGAIWEVGREARRWREAAERRWVDFFSFCFFPFILLQWDNFWADCLVGHQVGKKKTTGAFWKGQKQTDASAQNPGKISSNFPNFVIV